MLTIKPLKGGSAKAVVKYAEHERAREREREGTTGYYSRAGGAPSAWAGAGAAALGLAGRVDAADLKRLLEGWINESTTLTAEGKTRRLGNDLSFSAPKSLSVMAGAGDDRLLAAHDRAVREALAYVESDVAGARRGHGGATREATRNLIAATYRHEDARPVAGHVDMQVHTHCIVANATRRADGKWVAVDFDFGANAERMHLADMVFKSVLEREARSLGYGTRRTEHGFEIEGVSDDLIDQFSARRKQIDEALAGRGKTRETSTAAERTAANLATREAKPQVTQDAQRWAWRAETRELDRVRQAAERRAAEQDHAVEHGVDLSAESVRAAVRHLAERNTVFSHDAIALEAMRGGVGDVTLDRVRAEIDRGTGGLLPAGHDRQGREQYTTADALARERAILTRVQSGRGTAAALYDQSSARVQVETWERTHEIHLSQGQRAAVDLAITTQDRAVGVVGAAGAGKTTAMRAVVDAARARGADVIGLAPTTRAVAELRDAGVEPRTIASWLRDPVPASGQMILVDEAGMLSRRDMQALIERAGATDSRIVLVGDPQQLRSVEAGTPFAQMIESGAITHARIDEIQRQRDPALREIAQSFANGDAARAVDLARPYMREVQPVVSDGASKREITAARREAIAAGAAAEYLHLTPEQRQQTLVLAGTNEVRRQGNSRIRGGLHAAEPPAREVQITALDKVDLTRERATRAEHYTTGMVVALSEGKGKDRHIEHYTITGRVAGGNTLQLRADDGRERTLDPARETPRGVYTQREMLIAAGDRIAYREAQGSARDPGGRVPNGAAGTVVSLSDDRRAARVRLDDGRQVSLDLSHPQSIDYGWCRTVHASQGATVDRVIVAGEASRVMTAMLAYVACTRERLSLRIITDSIAKLSKAWARQAERQLAHEATRARPSSEELQRLREDLGRAGDLAAAREQIPPRAPEREREREREIER